MSMKYGVLAASVVLALTSQVASAASYAAATLGPISVTLYDLNPMDGILPSISWDNNNSYMNYVYSYAYDTANNNYQSASQWGTQVGSNNSVSSVTGQSAATASITAGMNAAVVDGASLSASGQANGTTTQGAYSQYGADAYAPYYYYSPFTLSANTAVVFSAYATTSAETTVGYQQGWGSESASATAYIRVEGSQPLGSGGSQTSSSYSSSYASYTSTYVWNSAAQSFDYIYAGQTANTGELLGASFTNLTNVVKQGYFIAQASISGYSAVASVPEADSYALMLAGLGLMGLVARRKSK